MLSQNGGELKCMKKNVKNITVPLKKCNQPNLRIASIRPTIHAISLQLAAVTAPTTIPHQPDVHVTQAPNPLLLSLFHRNQGAIDYIVLYYNKSSFP